MRNLDFLIGREGSCVLCWAMDVAGRLCVRVLDPAIYQWLEGLALDRA